MPDIGRTAAWGAQEWANYVLEHLNAEAVLLRSGARRINVTGTEAHVPRLLDDGTVAWVAEGTEIPSDAPEADTLDLVPKKLANVVSLSNESIADASVSTLNATGTAMTRAIAKEFDAAAFSTQPPTATRPAGLLIAALPGASGDPDIDGILDAIGVIEAAGGIATAAYLNPTDRTAIRKAVVNGGYNISDPTQPGVEQIGGARLYSVPSIAAGTALIAEAAQITVGLRQDASVSFSPDAGFTSDSTLARVVARADWKWNDTKGAYYIRSAARGKAKS